MGGRRISIITDFGCRRSCPYCVWRGHRLAGVARVAGWEAIARALVANPCGSVSVSGGGDPLFGAASGRDWWARLAAEASAAGKALHVHTREVPPRWLRGSLSKVVLSSDRPSQVPIPKLRDLAAEGTAVRLAKVVLPDTCRGEILEYLGIAEAHGWQVTFKELMAADLPVPGTPFRRLASELAGSYGGLRFLPGGDHNDYLMPDGHVYARFRAFPEDRRTP